MAWALFIMIWIAGLSYSEDTDASSWLTASVASKHINAKRNFNEINPGLGLRTDIGGNTLSAGIYKNSFSNASVYVGRYRDYSMSLNGVRIGGNITYGLVSGYKSTYSPGGLLPFILPGVYVQSKDFEVHLGILPALDAPVLTLSVGWRL